MRSGRCSELEHGPLEFLEQSEAAEERPEIRYYLGMTLEALGRTNEAKAESESELRSGGK